MKLKKSKREKWTSHLVNYQPASRRPANPEYSLSKAQACTSHFQLPSTSAYSHYSSKKSNPTTSTYTPSSQSSHPELRSVHYPSKKGNAPITYTSPSTSSYYQDSSSPCSSKKSKNLDSTSTSRPYIKQDTDWEIEKDEPVAPGIHSMF